MFVEVSTPAPAPLRASIGISPLIDSQKYQGNETPKEKKVFVAKKGAGPEMLEAPRRSVGPVRIEPPPKFRRIAESNSILVRFPDEIEFFVVDDIFPGTSKLKA